MGYGKELKRTTKEREGTRGENPETERPDRN